VGGRGRPKDDSTEGEKTQPFPCIIRCETVRFRLQKYRNGGQLWVVNVFSYTIHGQTHCWQSRSPLALSFVFPLLLWRFLSSQLFWVHYRVSQLFFSGQFGPPLGSPLLAHPLPAPSQLPTEALQRADLYPTSLHTVSLFSTAVLSTISPLRHLIITNSPPVCPSFAWTTDSYITCYPFARGLFIALMMEAVRTSETSVYSKETTRRNASGYNQ
jgi:hypothetical protein